MPLSSAWEKDTKQQGGFHQCVVELANAKDDNNNEEDVGEKRLVLGASILPKRSRVIIGGELMPLGC